MRELWTELNAEVVAAAPWIDGIDGIDGIDEVCEDIADRGERSMLITMSPDFFAEHLRLRGIDTVEASRFPPLPFTAAIDPARILEPVDKLRLAERERVAQGLTRRDCVAYGELDVRPTALQRARKHGCRQRRSGP